MGQIYRGSFEKGAHPWLSIPHNGDNFKTTCSTVGKHNLTQKLHMFQGSKESFTKISTAKGNPASFHTINNFQIGAYSLRC